MKKLIYTAAFSVLALGFVACSEAEDDSVDSENDIEQTEGDEISTEKTEELNKTIQLQEDAEKLDDDLDAYIKSL